jgi:short-subunit dehydrogenase
MGLELHGRRVLVTGASGGIGNAIARALHAKGATVVLTARRKELLDSLAAELGDRAEVIDADLADRASVESLVARAGTIDVLVANAGVQAAGVYDSFSAEEVDRALEVNLHAPMQLALALLPGMKQRGAGHLVFISSIAGKVGSGGGSVYSATKFGLRGWALGLRDDLRGSGVGVTTVFPGFIRDAGMFHDSGTKLPSTVGTRTPEQVAAAVVKGIERNKGEIDVAPLSLRSGSIMTALAPEALSKLQRRLGGEKVAAQLAASNPDKR